MSTRGFIGGAALAIVDQAGLSGINFLINLAFIRLATKVDYGIYLQLFAALLLSVNVHSAIIGSPLTVLGAKRGVKARQVLAVHLFWWQVAALAVLAVVVTAVVELMILYAQVPGLGQAVILPFILAMAGTWVREHMRCYFFLRLRPMHTLWLDAVYGLILLAGLVYGVVNKQITVVYVFWIMAIAGLISSVGAATLSDLTILRPRGSWRTSLMEAWSFGRWTLPSVVVSWGTNNTYVYFAAALVGVSATADIGAARLMLMPMGMCLIAWQKIFLPRASKWVGARQWETMAVVAKWSSVVLVLSVLAYVGVLSGLYGWLETHVLGDNYAGLQALILFWGLYFIVNAFRLVGTTSLVSAEALRPLFFYGVVALLVSVPAMWILTHWTGLRGTVTGLILGELILCALIWLHGWPRARLRNGMAGQPA